MEAIPTFCALFSIFFTAALRAEDAPAEAPPEMPVPTAEHKWLERFVGEWEMESELLIVPGEEPMKGTGSEKVRKLGGFWIVAEGTGELAGMTMHYLMTLGYDAEKKRYIGSWVDSMSGKLWSTEGAVDEEGTTLTLESEGPCPLGTGKNRKLRDVTEFKDADHRVFVSQMLGDDGKWVSFVKGEARRKK